jgi:uncharacterized protein YeaO (DUF488 family)
MHLKQRNPDAVFLYVDRHWPAPMNMGEFDVHFKDWFANLAPSVQLRRDHLAVKDCLQEDFRVEETTAFARAFDIVRYNERFMNEMQSPEAKEEINEVRELAKHKDVYLVGEERPELAIHRLMLLNLINGQE